MARSWLEVTTDEVQSKLGANQRLAERRAAIGKRARRVVEEVAAPLFQTTAQQGDWVYRERYDTEWSVVCCGIYGRSGIEDDPTAAFYVAEFDAYQPLVVLRRKAHGAAPRAQSRIVALDDLDDTALRGFLDD